MIASFEIIGIFNEIFKQKGRLRKGGQQLLFHCPFCFDKNPITQKLEIAVDGPDVGYYHCWRCNTKGRSFGSLLKKLNVSQHYRDAIFKFTGDVRLRRNTRFKIPKSDIVLPDEFLPLTNVRKNPEYKNAIAYLQKRNVLPEDIIRYNIGYCEQGEYAHHIIIPSYDAKGSLNFFIGRRYYKDDRGIPHKKPDVSMDIVGFESFVNYNEDINLCEGVFDAIAIRNNAIPLFGKYPSKKLRESMILHGTKRVNMVLDSDALHDAIQNCVRLQRDGITVHFVHLDGKDPSVIGFERIHELIKKSKEFDEMDLLKYKSL